MDQLKTLLNELGAGEAKSGEYLGSVLGLSRSGVWKLIQKLENQFGIEVVSLPGVGYMLNSPIACLDEVYIRDALAMGRATRTLGHVTIDWSVESTNDLALQGARKGDPSGSVWIAEHQTRGRGRRGREWVSPLSGNIYLSLLFRFSGGAAALDGLSLAVGVVVARVLIRLGLDNVSVKWPNDVYVDGKKMGGILIEISGDPLAECSVVIGVGLNLSMPVKYRNAIDQSVAALIDYRPAVERNAVIVTLCEGLIDEVARFERDGFTAFIDEWKTLDFLAGRKVTTNIAGVDLSGVATGVTSRGALLVQVGDEMQEVFSGEVSIRPV